MSSLRSISAKRFNHTLSMAVLMSGLIIGIAATLGRATVNLRGAVVNKPDIAVLLLMEERKEDVLDSTLLKNSGKEREYLVETGTGPKWVKLKQGDTAWFIAEIEPLRE